jgi:hypothetical protein
LCEIVARPLDEKVRFVVDRLVPRLEHSVSCGGVLRGQEEIFMADRTCSINWLIDASLLGGGISIPISSSPAPCYANCDGSSTEPILTVDDFICFVNEFAMAHALPPAQQVTHYANCDGSTTEPVLTVGDFICFINEFAQGCP